MNPYGNSGRQRDNLLLSQKQVMEAVGSVKCQIFQLSCHKNRLVLFDCYHASAGEVVHAVRYNDKKF